MDEKLFGVYYYDMYYILGQFADRTVLFNRITFIRLSYTVVNSLYTLTRSSLSHGVLKLVYTLYVLVRNAKCKHL